MWRLAPIGSLLLACAACGTARVDARWSLSAAEGVAAAAPTGDAEVLAALDGAFDVEVLAPAPGGAVPCARAVLTTRRVHGGGTVAGTLSATSRAGPLHLTWHVGRDRVRGGYVSWWTGPDGRVLVPLAEGHPDGEGAVVFTGGSDERRFRQRLELGRPGELACELARLDATGAARPVLLLRARRRAR